MLCWNGHAEHFAHTVDFHRNGRLGTTGSRLNFGLQIVVPGNAADFPVIGHPDQNHPAGGVGEGAKLPPEVGTTSALEFSGEALAQGDQIGERGSIHGAVSLFNVVWWENGAGGGVFWQVTGGDAAIGDATVTATPSGGISTTVTFGIIALNGSPGGVTTTDLSTLERVAKASLKHRIPRGQRPQGLSPLSFELQQRQLLVQTWV